MAHWGLVPAVSHRYSGFRLKEYYRLFGVVHSIKYQPFFKTALDPRIIVPLFMESLAMILEAVSIT
jgi:hypothetical protein